jgi:hypothetical protein
VINGLCKVDLDMICDKKDCWISNVELLLVQKAMFDSRWEDEVKE